jgi:hypothetical protein
VLGSRLRATKRTKATKSTKKKDGCWRASSRVRVPVFFVLFVNFVIFVVQRTPL